MENIEFVKKLKDIAKNYKTLYVMGCFGAPLNDENKERYCNNHEYNRQASRQRMIKTATADTFGFDCVCLIKGVLWGWKGDKKKTYGGAKYASNGVPDIGANAMITKCKNVNNDFTNVEIGEALWCSGHIGVYIGDGLAVECTPSFDNCVQITAVANMGKKSGYNARKWVKHGYLPYIIYVKEKTEEKAQNAASGYKAGTILELKNVKLYKDSKTKTATKTISGTYYVWNNEVINNRIKITVRKSFVGVAGMITGWIDAPERTFKTGQAIKLEKTPIYISASNKTAAGKKTGTFYIWNNKIENNRIRITNSPENAGNLKQVTGWVNVADI